MMSDPTTVDRATIDPATGKVVLIINEDRPWNDPETMHRELRSKVKRYVRYIRSEEFGSEYGREPGETLIRLVCSDPPDDATMNFLGRVRYELSKLGIGFDHRVEWFSDEMEGERPLTVEGWEARTRLGREFDDPSTEAESEPEHAPEPGDAAETEPAPEAARPEAPPEAADAAIAEPRASEEDLEPEARAAATEPEALEGEPETAEGEPKPSRPATPPAAGLETPETSEHEGSSAIDDLDVPAPPEGFQPGEPEERHEIDRVELDPDLDPFGPAPEQPAAEGPAGDEPAVDEPAPADDFTPMMGESRASPDMFRDIDHDLIEEPEIEEPEIEAPEGLETGPPEPGLQPQMPDLDRPEGSATSPSEPPAAPPSEPAEGRDDEEPDATWPTEEFGDMAPDLEGLDGPEPEEMESGEAEIEILAGEDDGEEIWQELSAAGDPEPAARVATEAEAEETAPSLSRAIGAALSTAVAFAVAWGLLAVAAGEPAGPVALALSLAVGFRVRLRGAGSTFAFRLIGGLGALLGCALGSLLATVGLLTVSEGLDVPALLDRFTAVQPALDTLGGFYGLTDLGVYALAILLSFWLSAARKPA